MASEDDKVDKIREESDVDHINDVINNSESSNQKPIEAEDVHRIDEEQKEIIEEDNHVHKHHDDAPKEHHDHKKPIKAAHPAHKVINHSTHTEKTPAVKKHVEIKQEHKKIHEKVHEKIVKTEPHVNKKPEHKKIQEKTVKPLTKKIVKDSSKSVSIVKKPIRGDKMAKNKEHKKGFKLSKNTLMWTGIGVLAAILVIALVLIISPHIPGKTSGNQTSNSVAATVNGEPIYLQDVIQAYNNLNPMIKSSYSVESMLNQSIEEELLYQQAKNTGIEATPLEVQSEIDAIKQQNNMNDSDLQAALAKQGLTMDSVKTLIEKNILVRKLLNTTILSNVTVTQEEIQNYYTLNADKFNVPAKVTVQHILIQVTPNVTENQSKAKIEQVKSELTNSNFCDLVVKYSDDIGSKNNCGIYTFAKGDFNNPEFENPSFSLGINETAIVKTVFGYHLIKKLDSIPARTMNLSEVSDSINKTIYNQYAQDNFEKFMNELKSKAVIVNYVTKTDTNGTIAAPAAKNLDDFAKCITSKGATFYGASWCPHCNNQKEMFGNSMQYVNYVECAVEGQPQVQTKVCTDAGISGYPTWIINNQSYPGEQTVESLAKLTGCAVPQ